MKRTEEWTKDVDWGVSTVIVDVHHNDLVRVDKELWEREFNGSLADVHAVVDDYVCEVAYSLVRDRLSAEGWSKKSRSDVAQA